MATRNLVHVAVAVGLMVPLSVMAALPPSAFQRARTEAAHHVQIQVTRVTPPTTYFGNCGVEGRVVRVFKGPLAAGANVRISFSCIGAAIGRNTKTENPPPSGRLFTETRSVQRARFLEAFMDGNPANVVFDQAVIIAAPTATALCQADQLISRCTPLPQQQAQQRGK